jgi:hypothetical protein
MHGFARILQLRRSFPQPLVIPVSMPRMSVRSFALFAATFFVAWPGALSGPPEVHAGCGDYVHVGRFDGATGTANRPGEPSTEMPSRDPAPSPTKLPCRGPSCRQSPLAPAAPAPVSLPNSGGQKACLGAPAVIELASPEWLISDRAVPVSEFPGRQIERPPRNCS